MARSYFNYESMLRWRAEWLEKQVSGKLLIKSTDRDFDQPAHGEHRRAAKDGE